MAKATPELISALQRTITNLEKGSPYEWGHMGSCNCGNLAQEITKLSKQEIHEYAMRGRGDWNDQIMDFCPTSGMPMDLLISQLLEFGLTREDLMNLEKLRDPEILERLPKDQKYLKHNNKSHVILYMKTWMRLLEEQLANSISIDISINETVTV
ncbi:MAG: hypothetical protein NXI20_12935 [bacterium]|nr:hypothetical protein [bacterium]